MLRRLCQPDRGPIDTPPRYAIGTRDLPIEHGLRKFLQNIFNTHRTFSPRLPLAQLSQLCSTFQPPAVYLLAADQQARARLRSVCDY